MRPVSLDRARAAKPKALARFRRLAKVVGVGVTPVHGGFAIKINIRQSPGPRMILPEAIDGVPVHVEVVGPVRKLNAHSAS